MPVQTTLGSKLVAIGGIVGLCVVSGLGAVSIFSDDTVYVAPGMPTDPHLATAHKSLTAVSCRLDPTNADSEILRAVRCTKRGFHPSSLLTDMCPYSRALTTYRAPSACSSPHVTGTRVMMSHDRGARAHDHARSCVEGHGAGGG